MFTPERFRAKAAEYADRVKGATGASQTREFQALERRFTALADEEDLMLRCLGAAVVMQWSTLPTKLQRELFDNATAVGELSETAARRGMIARFLHKRNDNTANEQ